MVQIFELYQDLELILKMPSLLKYKQNPLTPFTSRVLSINLLAETTAKMIPGSLLSDENLHADMNLSTNLNAQKSSHSWLEALYAIRN